MPASPLQALASRPQLRPYSERLAVTLSRSADPLGAPQRAAIVLEAAVAANEARLGDTLARRADVVARILSAVCGAAPFFVPILVKYPEWLCTLAEEDLATARSQDAYEALLATQLEGTSIATRGDELRRFKYYELARITVRELSADLVPLDRVGETLAELSHLADALLSSALAAATTRLRERHGASRRVLPEALGFVVLGLGKLGALAIWSDSARLLP